ncbi:WhiB family transcriptional regulator [Streptomyces sp. NPDC055607]
MTLHLDNALCAQTDPELFFPGKGECGKARDAKKVCGNCEEREACLEQALAREGDLASSNRFGVFGGLGPRQRARLAQQRRAER